MILHLNVNIGKQLTGIEKAAILRHNLLKKYMDSKIATMRYNPNLKEHMALYGLNPTDYENMYDSLQNISKEYKNNICLNDIFPASNYKIVLQKNGQDYRVYKDEQYIAYAHCPNEQINYINYFDSERKKRERHLFDCRGFLSNIKILNAEQQIISEYYLDVDGNKKIEKFYSFNNPKSITLIKVHLNNDILYLKNEEELMTLFLDQITTKNDSTISDKNILVNPAVLAAKNIGKKYAVIHSKHYQGANKDNKITNVYKDIFDNTHKFDGIIVSTETQKSDISERFKDISDKVFCIPVGVADIDEKQNLPLPKKDTTNFRIGIIARYYDEKRLDHAIKAFAPVIQKYPNIELHLFGFGDARDNFKTEKELRMLTNELNLQNNVLFRGYLLNLEQEWPLLNLQIVTSRFEGFCLAILEGMSKGIPTIAYDINYGPRDLINHNETGMLAEPGNIEQLTEYIEFMYKNNAHTTEISNNAYMFAKIHYNEKLILNKWMEILNDDIPNN